MEQVLAELKELNAKVERITGYIQPRSTPELSFRLPSDITAVQLQNWIEKHLQGKQLQHSL